MTFPTQTGVRLVIWVAMVVAIVMGATLAMREPWQDFTFTASSADTGFATTGRLDNVGPYDLIFHSNLEVGPWMEIDLLKSRTVSRLLVMNGLGCCRNRGVPLVFELADGDKHFVEVARQDHKFEVWDVAIAPRSARYARLRSPANTVLHLQALEIR